MEIDESGLMLDPRLSKRRAPGLTCLDALGRAKKFGEFAHNDSKGCGTIMRVAPVAFMHRREDVRAEAIATSALTHGHVTGQLAAAAWAEMLADVWRGEELERAAQRLVTKYARLEGGSETSMAIIRALEAPRDGAAETVETLGGGWIAEEALAIALYCSLSASNFEEGLRMAVTHSGDSDSTGSIAGNMLGLLYPNDIFIHRWAAAIECSDLISRLSRDLTAAKSWNENEIEHHWQEYPGW
jgi:ADP-ribosylglycohydrolase